MTLDQARAIVAEAIASGDDGTVYGPDLLRAAPALLADLDRLRSLPVLRTCGECGHASPRSRKSHLCDHPSVYDVADPHLLKIDHDAAPPVRCPLRGAR